jgi:hypothetical protein
MRTDVYQKITDQIVVALEQEGDGAGIGLVGGQSLIAPDRGGPAGTFSSFAGRQPVFDTTPCRQRPLRRLAIPEALGNRPRGEASWTTGPSYAFVLVLFAGIGLALGDAAQGQCCPSLLSFAARQ